MVLGAPLGSSSLPARRLKSSDSLPFSSWQPAQLSPFLRPDEPLCSDFLVTHSKGVAPGWNSSLLLLGTLLQSGAAKAEELRASAAVATAREICFIFIVQSPFKESISKTRRSLVVVLFLHALRLVVRDTLVAIDTGLLLVPGDLVHLRSPCLLLFDVHAFEAVAVAALAGLGLLHPRPFVLGEFQSLGLEFFLGIDGADDLAPYLLARLDLAGHLVHPVLGHVAVRADRANAGAVGVVDGFLVFLVNGVAHLVAGDAEFKGIGGFHGGVESAPEEDAGNETDHQQSQ